ncbi:MAG: hypothetical protein KC457_36165, partial [Myxococcales bacterium]|nr:hypothetical protein [Myxococcales bacterium]
DEDDLCPRTPLDMAFDERGCSGAQYIELSCGDCGEYPNHGQYVSCVSQAANDARKAGLLSNTERAGIVRAAAVASCH